MQMATYMFGMVRRGVALDRSLDLQELMEQQALPVQQVLVKLVQQA
jgi:hypothetical protein